ncbi:hypothetical protein [Hydrogenophaga pseudoflava]|uniref:hypothetical protein n=1 Tax=Hydrogenophaga pseudoflava TaxID=47421 RepID=UPI0027E3C3A0|nr:hypothetical protein [Hydrogenophaga pseudoflava]MDQ7744339.1 hypothetical protein [Hydrogenophaga pseudoflava]
MDPTDAFFTQTVVGAPFTVLLGRRRQPGGTGAEGLQVDLATGESRLSRLWNEWALLHHATPPGSARMRPGRVRRLMERHALWMAALGLLSLTGSAISWGVLLWK